MKKKLTEVQVGDTVHRYLVGGIYMPLKVTKVTDKTIYCGLNAHTAAEDGWTFDRETGMEIDDDLAWGPAYGASGSFILT